MRQRTHIFHRLEAIETMRAYVAHNVNENEDLLANLEIVKSETVATQELAKEGVGLLRKAEEKNVSQVKARQLVEEKTIMMAEKEKVEEEAVRLRHELQDPWVGFNSLFFFTLSSWSPVFHTCEYNECFFFFEMNAPIILSMFALVIYLYYII